ncbi:MAG: hypothetical protein AMXMBFR58_24440 [Phycisphaerae bacterium]
MKTPESPRDRAAQQWTELAKSPPSVGSVSASSGDTAETWPEPQRLPDTLPPVMPFDPQLLPEAFRAWVQDIADRIQCPIDFPAVGAMVALAAIVGRKVGIRPKREDDWTVVANLWGAAIGRPGVMKTPALQDPLKPMMALEMKAKDAFDLQVKESEAAKIISKVKTKKAERDIKGALNDRQKAMQLAMESLPDDEDSPKRTRYIVNDSSVEKLGEILNENPNGVLLYRDELSGLLKSLDKEGQEGARSFYLEAWNGNGRYCYDRIGRGTIDIEAAIISIVGGIQPGPLQHYLRGAAKEGAGDDGLMQRYQLMVWPDISDEWVNVDRKPDADARERAWAVFDGLNNLDPDLVYADHDPHDPGGIPFLRCSDQAQEQFDRWRAGLEKRLRSGELFPALESHLAKYRSLVPSLALLIHLADGGKGPIPLSCLVKAIAWAEYLETHARRVYAQVLHPDIAGARALGKKILSGAVADGFDLRSVYRKGWSNLTCPDEAKGAAELLEAYDWLRAISSPGDGRTGRRYWINPGLVGSDAAKSLIPPSKGTDKADRSPPDDPSVGSVSPSGAPSPDSQAPDEGWEVV